MLTNICKKSFSMCHSLTKSSGLKVQPSNIQLFARSLTSDIKKEAVPHTVDVSLHGLTANDVVGAMRTLISTTKKGLDERQKLPLGRWMLSEEAKQNATSYDHGV